jgi:hypothetical protein
MFSLAPLLSRPRVWGVAYLAAIPLFATVYALLGAHSFYDSNIQREPAVANDAASVRVQLTSVARTVTHASWEVYGTKVRLVPGTLVIQRIRHTQDGQFLAEATGRYTNAGKSEPVVIGTFIDWLMIPLDAYLRTVSPGGREIFRLPLTLVNEEGTPTTRMPFQPPISALFRASLLELSGTTYRNLVRFVNAVQGDPYYASGLWPRFAYFSAVTITTVGFGDITPVSMVARVLVGAEATVGVLLVGLFLNALTLRIRSRRGASEWAP